MKKLMFILLMLWAFVGKGQEARLVLPVGHTAIINNAVFSPDGKLVMTTSNDKTARIYDVATGMELHVLSGHKESVQFAEFSANGKLVITGHDKSARIYDVASGKELHVLNWDSFHYLNSASFSSDGKLALASGGLVARIYEVTSGKELHVLKGHTSLINSSSFSPDGKLVITASYDSTARIYEVNSGKELRVLRGHTHQINSAIFSPDSKLAITAGYDSTVRIYDVDTGKELRILRGHKKWVASAIFSSDGELALATYDSTAYVYEVSTGKQLKFIGGQSLISSAELSPDGKYILMACSDETARVYEVDNGKELLVLKGHLDGLTSAVYSPDGKFILTTSLDKSARIYEVATCNELKVLKGQIIGLHSAVISPDGKLAISASIDSVAIIYEVTTGKVQHVLKGQKSMVHSAIFSPDGKLALISSMWDFTVRIYDVYTGKQLQVLSGLTRWCYSAIFSPNNKLVLIISGNEANIFEIETGKELQILKGHTRVLNSVAFSHDSKLALTASDDFTSRIYEVSTGKELQVLSGHTYQISSAVFSPDGKLSLTAGADSTVRIYDVAKGKEIQILLGHTDWVKSAVFNTDGKLVLTESYDSTARIYEVSTGKELQVMGGHSNIFYTEFSPNGKLVLIVGFDNTARIYDVTTGKELHILKLLTEINSAFFSIDNKYALTIGSDHKTILWDATTGRALYTRIQLKNGDWLVYDENYRYDGSQGARDYLYFVCGLEVVDLAQVKDALYVPNLVQRIMNGENLDHLPKLKDLEICGVTPEVEPNENKKDGGYYYNIKARKGGVGKVEIYINGMLRQTLESKTLTQKDGIYELKIDEKLIQQYQIADKETELKVIARTADNKISSRGAVARTTAKETVYRKPSLHAIMVGIDDYKGDGLDLNYAAKDAIDLQTALKISTQKLFNVDDTNRVHFYNLTLDRGGNIKGLTPDRNNILKTLEKIEKESKPEDVFVLFFAGHGEINPEKQLILLTAEASKEQAPNYSGILMKELLEKLAKIPAGKRILLLDACHSGAAINELNIKDIAGVRDGEDAEKQSQRLKELENLASKSGLSIITASSTEQKAMELPQYEHGLMTYALLTTMMNDPEVLDKDNNLQLEDWLRQTEKNVSKLIENQSAQRFVPINFSLGKVDEEVRKSIILQEIPTIVVGNVYNKELDDDNLDIKTQLIKKLNEISTRGGADKILIVKEETPNAISVNLSYELSEGKIRSKITLKKDKKVFKQFNFEGNAADLNKFVEELSKEITKNLK